MTSTHEQYFSFLISQLFSERFGHNSALLSIHPFWSRPNWRGHSLPFKQEIFHSVRCLAIARSKNVCRPQRRQARPIKHQGGWWAPKLSIHFSRIAPSQRSSDFFKTNPSDKLHLRKISQLTDTSQNCQREYTRISNVYLLYNQQMSEAQCCNTARFKLL